MVMIATLRSYMCPAGYNYRYCAAATKVFLFLRLSVEQKNAFTPGRKRGRHITHRGLVKAERLGQDGQGLQLLF